MHGAFPAPAAPTLLEEQNVPHTTHLQNEEDVYKVEFDEWAFDNFVVAQLPPNALVDFRRAERPPSRVFFALFESLYGIAHANTGAEALLLPVLQLEPDEVDVGFEDGLDNEVALALVDGN